MKNLIFFLSTLLICTVGMSQVTTTLDGSKSYDKDGSVVGYKWVQTSGPGKATFVNPNVVKPTVTVPVPGTYWFHLTVTDNLGDTSVNIDSSNVSVEYNLNQRPKANAGPNQVINMPSLVVNNKALSDKQNIYVWERSKFYQLPSLYVHAKSQLYWMEHRKASVLYAYRSGGRFPGIAQLYKPQIL